MSTGEVDVGDGAGSADADADADGLGDGSAAANELPLEPRNAAAKSAHTKIVRTATRLLETSRPAPCSKSTSRLWTARVSHPSASILSASTLTASRSTFGAHLHMSNPWNTALDSGTDLVREELRARLRHRFGSGRTPRPTQAPIWFGKNTALDPGTDLVREEHRAPLRRRFGSGRTPRHSSTTRSLARRRSSGSVDH
jgi:hypothetical protein